MSEKKFTDGPWKFIERPNLDRLIVDEHGYTICFISRLAGPVTVQRANAQLISATPRLLGALESARVIILETIEALGPCDHSVNICKCVEELVLGDIDAAIAEAYRN